jgi:3-hydroxyisobutyrate dehydrogenase-like beta-hydroxyacid dehydrogenase
MRVGVIGIGNMGEPIARNLLRAGHSVIVYNRTPARAEALRSAGAIVARSVGEACAADAVLTMLSDDRAVEAVVFQSPEFLHSLPPGGVHASMSTISVEMARRLTAAHAKHGSQFVSAPVFGRPQSAADASLVILAAGPTRVIERVSPILNAIGKRIFTLGEDPYRANVVKLCGNSLLLSAILALAQAITFARAEDVDPGQLLGVLTDTVFTAPFYKAYGSLMLSQAFEPAGFSTRLALKDAELVVDDGQRVGVRMSSAITVRDSLRDAVQQGRGDLDVAALSLVQAAVRAER